MSKETKDQMGNRFKAAEECSTLRLIAGTPKIIRLDGKAFSNFSKDCDRPYDWNIMKSMADGVIAVMKEIGGSARFSFIQSDECSIVLNDKPKIESEPWFSNNVSKIVSVSASIMSVNFSQSFHTATIQKAISESTTINNGLSYVLDTVKIRPEFKPAYFDARIFQVPNIWEMHNAILWRQFDAIKNSKSQYARHYFSQKQVHGKNGEAKVDMMKSQHNFDWNTAPVWTKHGIIVRRGLMGKFEIDLNIPEFKIDKDYLVKLYEVPVRLVSA